MAKKIRVDKIKCPVCGNACELKQKKIVCTFCGAWAYVKVIRD